MTAQPGLCGTWSETPKTGFLTTRLIYFGSTAELSIDWTEYGIITKTCPCNMQQFLKVEKMINYR